MKEGWPWTRLDAISENLDKKRVPITKSKREAGDVPYYGASGIVDYVSGHIFDEDLLLVSEDGANLLARSYPIAFSVSGKTWVNNHAHVLRFRDIHSQKFIEYFLNSISLEPFVNGMAQPKLNQNSLNSIEVPSPPLSEQERIVAILDEAFAAIATATANAEKNLANARELFESELNRVFSQEGDGWVEATLGEMSRDFGRGKSKHRPRNADFLYGGDYPFVQTGDIRNSEHVISDFTQTYSEAGLAQSKLWPTGTICITIAANIAETGILGFNACFPDSIIGMVPEPEISDGGYVEYLLQFFKTELQRQGKGSAQDNLNLGTFKMQKFPFAPLPEQQTIASKLDVLSDEIKGLEGVQQHKLLALTELKQSILHKAFVGELTADAKAPDRVFTEVTP